MVLSFTNEKILWKTPFFSEFSVPIHKLGIQTLPNPNDVQSWGEDMIRKCPNRLKDYVENTRLTSLSTRPRNKQALNSLTLAFHTLVHLHKPVLYHGLLCLQLKIWMCTCVCLRGYVCVSAREQASTQERVHQYAQALPTALWVPLKPLAELHAFGFFLSPLF